MTIHMATTSRGAYRSRTVARDREPITARPSDGDAHLLNDPGQALEAAAPGRADAADRHVQHLGYLLVAGRVVAREEAEQALAAWRQLGVGLADDRCPLLGQGGQGVPVKRNPRTLAKEPQALPAGGGRQPRPDSFGVLDATDALDQ